LQVNKKNVYFIGADCIIHRSKASYPEAVIPTQAEIMGVTVETYFQSYKNLEEVLLESNISCMDLD
jgi:hypothetical protein